MVINRCEQKTPVPTGSLLCKRGFTLLEIMVALAIIGAAMVSLLSLGNRSLGVNERIQHITQATLLAQQKMAESELEAETRGLQQMSAHDQAFEPPFADYRWRREISATPLPAVKMVTITVLWGAADRNEGVDVTSFLF